MTGEWIGNILSTPSPKAILRTVKVLFKSPAGLADDGAFKGVQADLIGLAHFDLHLDRVADLEIGQLCLQ